jgi:hypothetical protein
VHVLRIRRASIRVYRGVTTSKELWCCAHRSNRRTSDTPCQSLAMLAELNRGAMNAYFAGIVADHHQLADLVGGHQQRRRENSVTQPPQRADRGPPHRGTRWGSGKFGSSRAWIPALVGGEGRPREPLLNPPRRGRIRSASLTGCSGLLYKDQARDRFRATILK